MVVMTSRLAFPFGLAAAGVLASYLPDLRNLGANFLAHFGTEYTKFRGFVPEMLRPVVPDSYSELKAQCDIVYYGKDVSDFAMRDIETMQNLGRNLDAQKLLEILGDLTLGGRTVSQEALALCKPFAVQGQTLLEQTNTQTFGNLAEFSVTALGLMTLGYIFLKIAEAAKGFYEGSLQGGRIITAAIGFGLMAAVINIGSVMGKLSMPFLNFIEKTATPEKMQNWLRGAFEMSNTPNVDKIMTTLPVQDISKNPEVFVLAFGAAIPNWMPEAMGASLTLLGVMLAGSLIANNYIFEPWRQPARYRSRMSYRAPYNTGYAY